MFRYFQYLPFSQVSLREIINELLHPKPYLVCTCGNFEPGERNIILHRVRCKKCNGWLNMEQIIDTLIGKAVEIS